MKILKVCILLLLAFFSLNIAEAQRNKEYRNVGISLFKDNSQVDIGNTYKLYFIKVKQRKNGIIKNKALILPRSILKYKYVDLMFIFQNDSLMFKDVRIDDIYMKQKRNWTFKIISRNFGQEHLRIDTTKIRMLHILEFNPLESGEGISIVKPIFNTKPCKQVQVQWFNKNAG